MSYSFVLYKIEVFICGYLDGSGKSYCENLIIC